jgi:hypothetical protein
MKTVLVVGIFLVCWPLSAAVVTNDAVLKKPGFGALGDYGLELTISPTAYLIAFNDIGNYEFQVTSWGIAGENHIYLAPIGTRLDPAYASQAIPFFNNAAPTSAVFSVPFNTKLTMSYWLDVTHAPPYNFDVPDNYDSYGWVEFYNNGNGLIVTKSATAHGGGIIVGTTTQVPEPTSGSSAMGFAAAAVLHRIRRNRRKRCSDLLC